VSAWLLPRTSAWWSSCACSDGSANPAEFLQIYTTILAVGGNEAVTANYFPEALIGPPQSWLMNLPQRSLTSGEELCR
jgi:hypothetical protein